MTTSSHANYRFISPNSWQDYALLDSGEGARLERFGKLALERPDAEAIWQRHLSENDWRQASARFVPSNEVNGGHWEKKPGFPEQWTIDYRNLKLMLQLGGSKQVGLFPEQASQWDALTEIIRAASRPVKLLNLFGYTGVASLAAAAAGASVTHVDSSRKVIEWGKHNQQLSGVDAASIRWIVDDALKFVRREANRGNHYDAIVMDPPKFGRGPKGEVWEFYKWLPLLLQSCQAILAPKPLLFLLTAYAVKASALTLQAGIEEIIGKQAGEYQIGETVLREESAGRLLSTSIYCLWTSRVS